MVFLERRHVECILNLGESVLTLSLCVDDDAEKKFLLVL